MTSTVTLTTEPKSSEPVRNAISQAPQNVGLSKDSGIQRLAQAKFYSLNLQRKQESRGPATGPQNRSLQEVSLGSQTLSHCLVQISQ